MLKCASNTIILYLMFLPVFFLNAFEYKEKPIVVLVTSYNNIRYVKKNITSICNQDYSNYRVIYIDDCSKDQTFNYASKLINKYNKILQSTLIKNQTRVGALKNIYDAIHNCNDDEIIVSLDGDDWFFDNQVLKKINEAYLLNDIWITHGTLIEFPSQNVGWSIPIPPDIITRNAFRSYRCVSHLRTFYAWLFKMIKIEDLVYEGEFFKMAWDLAILFPMMEMAGDRHFFIKDIVYVYNMMNPINDNKVNAELQRNLDVLIRSKIPYKRLKERPLS